MDKAGTQPKKMEWTKAEIDSELQGRAQNAAEQAMAQAINAADKRDALGGREGREGSGAQHLARGIPRARARDLEPPRGHRVPGHAGSRCWSAESGWMAATSTPSGRSASRPASCRGPTGRPCSPGVRPRPSSRSPSAPPTTSSGSTASTWPARRPSRSCCTTTSRPTPRAR